MGESAGGGSVLNHIVQSRSGRKAPFNQAIIQSPGLLPVVGNYEPESHLQEFLSILGVGSLTYRPSLLRICFYMSHKPHFAHVLKCQLELQI